MGICTADSIINLALCCLGYIPGLLHAWYIIIKNPEPDHDDVVYEPISGNAAPGQDVESGRVAYYYVSHQPQPAPQPQRSYGTVGSQSQSQGQHAPKPNNQESGGSSAQQSDSRPPPTYAEAVRGDNKVQTEED